jgi:hypothetical protein
MFKAAGLSAAREPAADSATASAGMRASSGALLEVGSTALPAGHSLRMLKPGVPPDCT